MNPNGLFGSNPFAALSLIAAPAVLIGVVGVGGLVRDRFKDYLADDPG